MATANASLPLLPPISAVLIDLAVMTIFQVFFAHHTLYRCSSASAKIMQMFLPPPPGVKGEATS